MMLQGNPRNALPSDNGGGHQRANEAVVTQRNPSYTSKPRNVTRDTLNDSRSERDHWLHDFRNALGNTTIAASAVRLELHDGRHEQVESLLRQIEEGCERCLGLLGTMPR